MNQTATLLIVDDVPANIGLVAESLETQGYRVLVAQDGKEGLARARHTLPDLILLDVMMPGLDGFEVCRRLKADAATREIPVLFMTALADGANKLAGFEAGGVDYVTKPVDVDELRVRVDTHLSLHRLQRDLSDQNQQLQQANRRLTAAQAQLLQAEKMASIGLIAAGVAHEINNPLGFVSSNLGSLACYVEQLLALLDAYAAGEAPLAAAAPEALARIRALKAATDLPFLREDLKALLDESGEGLGRVKGIVQDLKAFAHGGESEWQPADLNAGLDSCLNIVAHRLGDRIEVRREYGRLPQVECMPVALNQVFINLLLNAAHAIVERGEIRIRTGSDGDGVWVEIADSGVGIAPEHLNRIFDPFFTTRAVGQGSGLGLALGYATVRQHGGEIRVESTPGQGSRFLIRLPLSQPKAATDGDGDGQADPRPANPQELQP